MILGLSQSISHADSILAKKRQGLMYSALTFGIRAWGFSFLQPLTQFLQSFLPTHLPLRYFEIVLTVRYQQSKLLKWCAYRSSVYLTVDIDRICMQLCAMYPPLAGPFFRPNALWKFKTHRKSVLRSQLFAKYLNT
jgi:hypothetical protein